MQARSPEVRVKELLDKSLWQEAFFYFRHFSEAVRAGFLRLLLESALAAENLSYVLHFPFSKSEVEVVIDFLSKSPVRKAKNALFGFLILQDRIIDALSLHSELRKGGEPEDDVFVARAELAANYALIAPPSFLRRSFSEEEAANLLKNAIHVRRGISWTAKDGSESGMPTPSMERVEESMKSTLEDDKMNTDDSGGAESTQQRTPASGPRIQKIVSPRFSPLVTPPRASRHILPKRRTTRAVRVSDDDAGTPTVHIDTEREEMVRSTSHRRRAETLQPETPAGRWANLRSRAGKDTQDSDMVQEPRSTRYSMRRTRSGR